VGPSCLLHVETMNHIVLYFRLSLLWLALLIGGFTYVLLV
jgi:hypothetical protein